MHNSREVDGHNDKSRQKTMKIDPWFKPQD